MPSYELTGPDGTVYQEDGATEQEAFSNLQTKLGTGTHALPEITVKPPPYSEPQPGLSAGNVASPYSGLQPGLSAGSPYGAGGGAPSSDAAPTRINVGVPYTSQPLEGAGALSPEQQLLVHAKAEERRRLEQTMLFQDKLLQAIRHQNPQFMKLPPMPQRRPLDLSGIQALLAGISMPNTGSLLRRG